MTLSKSQKQRLERIYLIAKIDFNKRYYGSKLGVIWAFLNPLLHILVYFIAFSYIIGQNREPDFILYLFTGIITWQFFTNTTKPGVNLFRKQKHILENTPIPKIDFFLAHISSSFFAYFINFIIYFLFSILFFNPQYSFNILYIIPIFFGLICFGLGVTLFLSTLFLFFRDLNHIWDIFIMAGFWYVPILWDYKIIISQYPFMLYNPITIFLINIRQITLNKEPINIQLMYIGLLMSLATVIGGYLFMYYKSKKAVEII